MIPIASTDPFQVLRRQIRRLAPRVRQPRSDEDQQLAAPRGQRPEQRLRLNHFRGLHRFLQHRPPRLEIMDIPGFQQLPHVLLDPVDHPEFRI